MLFLCLQKLEAELGALQTELPALQRAVESSTAELANAEIKAEALVEGVKGEVEGYHQQLSQVGFQSRGVKQEPGLHIFSEIEPCIVHFGWVLVHVAHSWTHFRRFRLKFRRISTWVILARTGCQFSFCLFACLGFLRCRARSNVCFMLAQIHTTVEAISK